MSGIGSRNPDFFFFSDIIGPNKGSNRPGFFPSEGAAALRAADSDLLFSSKVLVLYISAWIVSKYTGTDDLVFGFESTILSCNSFSSKS